MTSHVALVARAGLALIAVAAFAASAGAAELKPRLPGAKQSYQAMAAQGPSERVVVKFREGLKVRPDGGGLKGLAPHESGAFANTLRAAGVGPAALRRLHSVPEAALDAQRAEGEAESGQKLADLNLYYTIKLPAGADAAAVADALNALPFVEYAEPAPKPAPPPVDIAPTTPNFTSQQGYRTFASGVGALNGTAYPGGDGKGIRVVDTEYSWRLDHEDLEIPSTRILTNGQTAQDPFNNRNHGTAVLGEIVGKIGPYGVTGIAPRAQAYVAPANTVQSGYSPARGITTAGQVLRRGDVLIMEQQYWVCGYPQAQNRYGPVETLQDVFDAVSALTARGVIVVSAAGNGNVDLDAPECGTTFNRNVRDSKAIIVGAGDPSTRSRLSFSSFGSRVDVQGWGQSVTTSGYGGLFNPGDERQYYTSTFNGTSSATPIVTGAAIAIQGVRKACGLPTLPPTVLRKVMRNTGKPQGPGAGQIGPLPRILAALKATDAQTCVNALGAASGVEEDPEETASLD